MAQFNTPVGQHMWKEVTHGVSQFNAFVQGNSIVNTEQWANTLNTLHVTMPTTLDKTTPYKHLEDSSTITKTWKTLVQVQNQLDELSHTVTPLTVTINKYITACKNRTKAFRIYCEAFTAFLKDSECPLREYLKAQFPGHATQICKELGALENKHLTFPEVSAHMNKPKSLTFLDIGLKRGERPKKWDLQDRVELLQQELKPQQSTAPPKQQQPADPPRRPLVVVVSKAQLENMRACLLSM